MTVDQILREVRGAATASRPGKAQDELLKLLADLENAAGKNGIDIQPLLSLSMKEVETAARPIYKSLTKLRTAAKKNRRTGGKDEIVRACRNRLGDGSVDWIDSAVVLRTTTKLMYPPLLGTGGSEGRLDYTNCFMERLAGLLLSGEPATNSLLGNALFGQSTTELAIGAVGQLDPGRAGGYNQGPGIGASCPINHWDFVFAMEGAVAWASGAARRQGIGTHGVSCSPFTVRSRPVGYGSADEGDQASARAEIWMPVWERPSRFEEVRTLLREGRVEWGGKPVEDAMQFAEAAVSLGTQRGSAHFSDTALLNGVGTVFSHCHWVDFQYGNG